MKIYLSIVNTRTILALAVSVLVSYITLFFKFNYNYDLALISIAIIFPLVFTIRSAFRRREKALEYLSGFKAGLQTVHHYIQESNKLDDVKKEEAKTILKNIPPVLVDYLRSKTKTKEDVAEEIKKVATFMRVNDEYIGNGTASRVYRFMKDVYESFENVVAINQHRTPIAIRAYCLIFIYLYPVIYTPALYNRLHDGISFHDSWILFALSAISTFILISLYNVQDQMEHPFDQHGLDDIQLTSFTLDNL